MKFKTSKILGGVGALLMFLGGILSFMNSLYFTITEIMGIILVLLSLYSLANFYKNKNGIFYNALFGVLTAIVGVVTASVFMMTTVLSSIEKFLYQMYPNWNGDMASLQDLTPNTTNLDFSAITSFIIGLLLVLIVLSISAIIAAFFIRRSLIKLSTYSETGLFATAGTLLLIGALLTILLVGILFVWITGLILAIAFFSMKEHEHATTHTITNSLQH
ncbi:MAG: DUF996 domain-containing protein [Nitrososphaerota archaeon]|jgi:uncharacterized membrane protein|nr:DUF996 domain-containing protein [Nitrososphaerota archaeon]